MKQKFDFKPYKVGTVFNRVKEEPYKALPRYKSVTIKYPCRLNLMAIDPSKISSNNNMVYTPGEIILTVKIYKEFTITLNKNNRKIVIDRSLKRKSLIKHAALLMKKAIGFKQSLTISSPNLKEIKHVGLGSSSALIATVATAINELYGKPISSFNLVQYIAQNHGEELGNSENYLAPVQCIGGSACGGHFHNALKVIAGQTRMIKSMNIPSSYNILIGIPNDFVELDSKTLLDKELSVMDGFISCGKKYGPKIAYDLIHLVFPAMEEGDLKTVGDLIYEYRFNMGSIRNCSYAYSKLVELTDKLRFLKEKNIAEILSISSVGPAVIAVTKYSKKCKLEFERVGLNVITTKPENRKYSLKVS